MVYKVNSTSFTKINETSGTIQNSGEPSSHIVEMTNDTLKSGLWIYPREKHTFNGANIYLRCVEEGFTSEVRVVPFTLDGGGTSAQVTVDGALATDSEIDNMLDELLPTITGGN